MATITVVGLGPAGPDLVTAGALDAIGAHEPAVRFARTRRHPAVSVLGDDVHTFDAVYDEAATMAQVYETIVARLLDLAGTSGRILYAVPGSPMVAERTVELLLEASDLAPAGVAVEIHAGLSFLDLAWARLGVDPVATGARVIDGHRFAVEAAGQRGPLLVAQCDSLDVLSDIKLAIGEAFETRARLGSDPVALDDDLVLTVVQHLGLPDERVDTLRWDELDRAVDADHLTSVWIPAYAAPVAREVERFAELVSTLRRECPWDREQTHASLQRHLLEESYEVLDALDHLDVEHGTGYEHLEEELGDLLFQIVFHTTLASEAGQFTLADVARTVHDKLYARHPHVFGAVDADSADQVAANWEELKKAEKGRASVFDGTPDALPALLLALKVQKKAAGLGVEAILDHPSVFDALDAVLTHADATPVDASAALGELLFAVVQLARGRGVDPETALRSVAMRYREAAQRLERGTGHQ